MAEGEIVPKNLHDWVMIERNKCEIMMWWTVRQSKKSYVYRHVCACACTSYTKWTLLPGSVKWIINKAAYKIGRWYMKTQ